MGTNFNQLTLEEDILQNNATYTGLDSSHWNSYEKISLRFFTVYFGILIAPWHPQFFIELSNISITKVTYADIFNLTHYLPYLTSKGPSFTDWLIFAIISAVVTIVWSALGREVKNYDKLYYLLRAVIRYRLAAALLVFGFIKLFPMQMPEPSLSLLNSRYGDSLDWKIFSESAGIVPSYESFLGFIEILFAILLLNRKTASIGALGILAFTGNVFFSNLAYEGGEYVYSFFLISLALFVFAFDAVRFYQLLTLEKLTLPNRFKPTFTKPLLKNLYWSLKALFVLVFLLIYGWQTYNAYKTDPYQYPNKAGIPGTQGLYNVTSFNINNKDIPYNLLDPWRWQDVVFEKWNTISIRSNRAVIIDSNNVERIRLNNVDRKYEVEGSGGRHYYEYHFDSKNQQIVLHNRNKHYRNEQLLLTVSRPFDGRIVLEGLNEKKDSIKVILDRVNKKYLLKEVARQGRNKALKL